jgi:flagellar L-ring protein precursor FlgH
MSARPARSSTWSRLGVAAFAALAIAGCVHDPLRVVEVHQPLSARPAPPPAQPPSGGAIYSAATYQPLFEDHRARRVGDTLTIVINEKINASKKASTTADRKGTAALDVANVNLGSYQIKGGGVSGTSKGEFAGGGDSASNNVFTGTITVTVIDVLPNGNLIVSGEKQIGINQGSEFVRVSGIVNPFFIFAGNTISSTQVADARLEYRGTGYIDEAQTMGWLSRAFLSVFPF